MTRQSPLLLAALCMGLLLAPAALAQTPPPTPPMDMHADMQQQRTAMTDRMQRMDRDWQDYERRVGAIRDTQRRTAAQQQMEQMRTQRDALRQDMTALGTMQGEQAMTRQREIQQRMGEMDSALYEARLGAAETRDAYRQTVDARMRDYSDRIGQHSGRLQHIPENRRAEAAYELIRLRGRHDNLMRQHRGMARMDQTRFTAQRDAMTRDLAAFDRDVHTAEGTLMDHHRGTRGQQQGQMQPPQRPTQQQGQMQQQQGQQQPPQQGQQQQRPPQQQDPVPQQERTQQQGQQQQQQQGRPPQNI